MSNKELNDIAQDLLEMLDVHLKKVYGKSYQTKLTTVDKGYTLSTEELVLFFRTSDKHFYLTFKIGLTGKKVAELTKEIMVVLTHYEFSVLDDSYYDPVEKKMYYGDEAIEVMHKNLLDKTGYVKCSVCEKAFKKSYIEANGICKSCNQTPIVWC